MKLSLGAFIATLRKEKGLTQKQLAEMLCVSDKTVSHWEREESSPDISLIPVIADIFGITADELLRGYRKEEKAEEIRTEENENTAVLYALESAYNKFRTKCITVPALSVIAVLCGFIVQYFKTIYISYLVFIALIVVPVLLAGLFRGSFTSFLSSPYIKKDILKNYFYKSNRITANCLYFSAVCFAFYSLFVIRFNYPYISGLLLIALIFMTGLLLCEAFLRKADILSKSGKPLEIKKISVLRIVCIFLTVTMLYIGYLNHRTLDIEQYLYESAEYTSLANVEDFVTLMETEKEAPDELFYTEAPGFMPVDKDTEITVWLTMGEDSRTIDIINPDFEECVTFTYKNLEIAEYRQYDKGLRVYTHAQLLAAEEIAREKVDTVHIMYFVYYAVVILTSLISYKLIKRAVLKRAEKDKITLIKDF